ncbi:Hpt domain-containing protein [Pseudomonas sp. TH31]|uniref:Hpt domain-containing protein n=1 Tax=Pseudomonas sp. TH31 TaxID=2796396 RepID=UPI00313D0465
MSVEEQPVSEIDLSSLEQYVGSDRALINRLVHDLAQTNREDREHLLQAHAAKNRQGLRDLAHRIKGSARMVRALQLIECCEQLEQVCAEGRAAMIDEAVERLQQTMARLDESFG